MSRTSIVKAVLRKGTADAEAIVVETVAVRDQRIAARAYERFVARGYVHGHDVEDWLAAEAEI